MATVKRISEDEAVSEGFSSSEIVASRSHPEGYFGTKNGAMYFNTQVEIKMGDFDGGSGTIKNSIPLPGQYGEDRNMDRFRQ